MKVLQVNGVTKSFGDVRALNSVSFSVDSAEVLGLLGPNGSGKSTLMKIILGILKPDAGNIQVLATDVSTDPIRVKKTVGYVPESPRLYEFLTGTEYLDFVADLYGLSAETKKERIDEFLTAFELRDQGNDLLAGYSLGMKQKIALSAALIHRPKILILDEALNGLDPRTAKIVKDTLIKLSSNGVTMLFSTHVLEIAEAICQKVTILEKGNIIAEGNMDELRARAGGSTLESVFLNLTGSADVRAIVDELTAR